MKRLTREIFNNIKAAVEKRAEELGVSGFMIVADLVTGVAMFALVNTESAIINDNDGMFNAAAIAGAKFGMVFVSPMDTGYRTEIVGEVPWKGGHISKSGDFIYCFSGAAQEIDLEMMVLAEQTHLCDTSEPVQMITASAAMRFGARISDDECCPNCRKNLLFRGEEARCGGCGWTGVNLAWFQNDKQTAGYDIVDDPRR